MGKHEKHTDTIAFGCPACHADNTVCIRALTQKISCRRCRTPVCPIKEPVSVREISFAKIVRSAAVPVVVSLVDNRLEECRRFAPDLHDVARKFMGSIIVVIVHADACPEVFMRLSNATGPPFVIFHRGTIVEELSGVAQKATIERCIQALVPERTERPHRGFLRHVLRFFSGRSSVHGSREGRSIVHAA